MAEITLFALERDQLGKGLSRRLRAKGLIPAVLYGKKTKPRALSLNPKDLYKAVSTEAGLNALIHLKISGDKGAEDTMVLVKELQIDSMRRVYLHADLFQIDVTDEVKVEVPVELVGKSKGVKEGGILQHNRRALEVFCQAGKIPKTIEVDISDLEVGDSFHLEEIKFPAGVRPTLTINVTIVACVPPEEEEVAAVPAVAVPTEEEAAAAEEGAPTPAPGEGETKEGESKPEKKPGK